jgi:hypothetical protein
VKRVPFKERLWRPAPYMGEGEDRKGLDRMVDFLAERRG